MEITKLTGPVGINLVEGGDEGDRIIRIASMEAKQYEIGPIPKELAHILASALSMSDEELREAMEREMREQQAAESLILPDSARNGQGPLH